MRQIWIALCFFLSATVIFAQIGSQGVVVVTPVRGQLVFSGSTGPNPPVDAPELVLVDTSQGSHEVLSVNELSVVSPRFDWSGEGIAYTGDNGLSLYNLLSQEESEIAANLIQFPQGFSPDGRSILTIERRLPPNHRTATLGIIEVSTGVFQPLFSFTDNEPITSLPPAVTPQDPSIIFSQLRQARWNPSFAEWMLLQISTGSALGIGEEFITPPITFLYNLQTSETVSLDALFPTGVSLSTINWNADGTLLYVSTFVPGIRTQTAMVAFDPNNSTMPVQVIAQAASSGYVQFDWLGAGNLLLMIQSGSDETDFVLLIAEIINGQLYTTEFLRLPKSIFPRVRDLDWHITASDEEKRQLTCLFDQTLPAQLQLNAPGRVTLGGTTSRLRDDHSVRADVITQMAPGNPITIVGLPYCEDGYRWWQIQLENGTVGWAAEASTSEYFLEPLITSIPTATPTFIPTSTATDTATSTFTPTDTATFTDTPTPTTTYTLTEPIHARDVLASCG